jgi:hypothetical protein
MADARIDEARHERNVVKAQLDALRKGLQDEVERLREAAAKCRDNALRAKDVQRGAALLAEGEAHDQTADDLAALLDSSGGER